MSQDLASLLEELGVDDPPVQQAPTGERRWAHTGQTVEAHAQPTMTMAELDEAARERMERTGQTYEQAMLAEQNGVMPKVDAAEHWDAIVQWAHGYAAALKPVFVSLGHAASGMAVSWGSFTDALGMSVDFTPADLAGPNPDGPRAQRRARPTKVHRCNGCGQQVPGGLCRTCTKGRR